MSGRTVVDDTHDRQAVDNRYDRPAVDDKADRWAIREQQACPAVNAIRPAGNAIREDDARAIERVLAGDRDAYRVLVERHGRNVYRLAFRMTGNAHDAEEIVQESFLRAYQKLEKFEARANFGTWVYRIASNYGIDRMRQRQKEEARREKPNQRESENVEHDPLAMMADAAPSPERLMQSVQLRKEMERVLRELSHAERTAFMMRYWEGCGTEEIAEVLKSSSNAAKNTVFRAVQKLRKALEPFLEMRSQAKAMETEP